MSNFRILFLFFKIDLLKDKKRKINTNSVYIYIYNNIIYNNI